VQKKYQTIPTIASHSSSSSAVFFQTWNTFRQTRSLSNATFACLIMWRSSSLKSAVVYKISPKSDIFHRDMAIYRFSKWRPSAICELFYHDTRPPTKSVLLAAAACHISCQSDRQIWRYNYLNFFAYLAWNAYSGTQKGGFRGLWTPNCDYSSSRPPKGTSLHKSVV